MQALHISIVQMDLAWEAPGDNIRKIEQLLSSVEQTDVIVLPEMFSTGFSMTPAPIAEEMHGPTMYWMRKLAGHYEALVVGSMIIEENGQYYNRFIAMDGFGLVHQYDKIKLFSMTGEDVAYTAGTQVEPFVWKDWRIMPQVCYDLRFPEQVRLPADQGHGFDVLMYVANWPSPRVVHWDTLVRARAIENQCYVVAANRVGEDENELSYVGHSAIVNPMGETLVTGDQEDVLQATLEPETMQAYRDRFPIWKDA